MASIQERLQMKREPLDKWSVREQLCLVSAVNRSGDQNWISASRALKPFAEPNRPSDWFNQKNCGAQFGALLASVETPKRKKRASGNDVGIETSVEVILRKLVQERQAELKTLLAEERAEYLKLQEDMTLLQSGNVSEEQLDIWCKEIDEEEQRKEEESIANAQWLKEREQRKQEIERGWRPNKPQQHGIKRKNSDSIDSFFESEHNEEQQQIVQSIPQEHNKPALSPLLTSLLKSPSQVQNVVTSSILHSAITNQRPVNTNTNPMIASLLNSSANVSVSPSLQQLVSSAIGQEQQMGQQDLQPLGTDILDDASLPNLKIDDLANSILVPDGPLPEIKNEEVDVIISDLIENAHDIVADPEQHLQLDGNGDININLELDDLDEADDMLEVKDPAQEKSVDKPPVPAIDPFEFQEDPVVFEHTKMSSSLKHQQYQQQQIQQQQFQQQVHQQLQAQAEAELQQQIQQQQQRQQQRQMQQQQMQQQQLQQQQQMQQQIQIQQQVQQFQMQEQQFQQQAHFQQQFQKNLMEEDFNQKFQHQQNQVSQVALHEQQNQYTEQFQQNQQSMQEQQSQMNIEQQSQMNMQQQSQEIQLKNVFDIPEGGASDSKNEHPPKNDQENTNTENETSFPIKDEEVNEEINNDPPKNEDKNIPGSVEIVEVLVMEKDEIDKQLNKAQIQDIVLSANKDEDKPEDIQKSETGEEDRSIKAEASESEKPNDSRDDMEVKEEDSKTEEKGEFEKSDIDTTVDTKSTIDNESTLQSSDFSEELYDDINMEIKVDKSGRAKRDYSRTKKKEEKDFDLLVALEKTQLVEGDLTDLNFSDKEYQESDNKDGKIKEKSENERSNSPWTEEEDSTNAVSRVSRRYSTPATPVDSIPNSPASSSANYDDEREYRNWKKSVMLVFSRLTTHKYASLFLKPITDDQAPGYHNIVYRPTDLQTIRKNIENGNIRTTQEFQRDVLLMFTNAIMYNKTNDTVYNMARQMQQESLQPVQILLEATQQQDDGPLRRETRTSETGGKRKRGPEDLLIRSKKKKEE